MTAKRTEYQMVILRHDAPYSGTKTRFEDTMKEIRLMLEKHGITKIGEMSERVYVSLEAGGKSIEAPLITLAFTYEGKGFMLRFPIIFRHTKDGVQLRMGISARIVLNRIKDRLLEVDLGLLDFTQALCPYLALVGPDQITRPFEEVVKVHPEILAVMGARAQLPGGGE